MHLYFYRTSENAFTTRTRKIDIHISNWIIAGFIIIGLLSALYLYNNLNVTVVNSYPIIDENGQWTTAKASFNIPLHYAIDFWFFGCDIPEITYP